MALDISRNTTAKALRIEDMIEVVSGRLYIAREDVIGAADFKTATVVVNLSSKKAKVPEVDVDVYLRWDVGDDVEEKMFETLVRMVAGIMRAPKQLVVLVGHHDTCDIAAACILREYLGCKARIAVSILREARPKCLDKPDLLDTVENYRIS